MKHYLLHTFALLFVFSLSSCAYKTCATYTYDEDTYKLQLENIDAGCKVMVSEEC